MSHMLRISVGRTGKHNIPNSCKVGTTRQGYVLLQREWAHKIKAPHMFDPNQTAHNHTQYAELVLYTSKGIKGISAEENACRAPASMHMHVDSHLLRSNGEGPRL